MSLKKYGDGSGDGAVIPEETEEQQKTAAANWTKEDTEELQEELAADDAPEDEAV